MIESLTNSKVSPVKNICQFCAKKKAFPKSVLTIFLFVHNKLKIVLFGFNAMVTIQVLNLGNHIIYLLNIAVLGASRSLFAPDPSHSIVCIIF